MPALKLVYSSNRRVKPKKAKYGSSRSQRAAYQATFPIYFSEGYVANLQHSLDFQSHELTGAQRQNIRAAIQTAKRAVEILRRNLA